MDRRDVANVVGRTSCGDQARLPGQEYEPS